MDILHGHEVVPVDLPEVEDLHNVYMLKLDGYPSLIDEHLNEFLILGHVIEHTLDHQNLLESCHTKGPSAIDLGHAARSNLLEQLVLAEMLRTGCAQRDLSDDDCNHR